MSTMNVTNEAKRPQWNFKRPELLIPQASEAVKTETMVIKLERTPAAVNSPTYHPDRLVSRLNALELRNQVIKSVTITQWELACRMDDEIIGLLAKGTDVIDLNHYVWYGRHDTWQHDLKLDDLVELIRVRHGNAIRPAYLNEKFLQLEFTVTITLQDRD